MSIPQVDPVLVSLYVKEFNLSTSNIWPYYSWFVGAALTLQSLQRILAAPRGPVAQPAPPAPSCDDRNVFCITPSEGETNKLKYLNRVL